DEPIGVRTTYRVGGAATLFVLAEQVCDLERVSAAVAATGIELLVLGRGSNLLVADAGFDGLCVTLGEPFAEIVLDPASCQVRAGGAAYYPVLARQSSAAGMAGMEWAVGIPGSVGGAVAMNAGGHGSQTSDRLLSCRVLDLGRGVTRRRAGSELELGYRRSSVQRCEIVLEATFGVEPGDTDASAAEVASIVRWRREHQPGGRNAGSVFTNPPGDSAGRLVEAAGLKGLRIGSAEVSTKHANFILADAGGSAEDVHRLIEEVRRLVAARLGVELATELRMIGFGPSGSARARSSTPGFG
ncbi:MAG TPA: UDP-N-acetylmuramate dehydrogenase, partial [Acidimicrobiales bacterium]|nr:UDP-N-acetylmuramate dehydrogenase [Acidimicrobiales bacterium]